MANLSDLIADDIVNLTVDLERTSLSTRYKIRGLLIELADDISKQLLSEDILTNFKKRRLKALQKQINEIINKSFNNIKEDVSKDVQKIGALEATAVAEVINRRLEVNLIKPLANKTVLKNLVDDSLIRGSPMGDWFNGLSLTTQQGIMREIRIGILEGETNDEIVRRIRGRHTGKFTTVTKANGERKRYGVFSGGAFSTITRHAETIVRTGVQTISQNIRNEIYNQNMHIIKYVQALAVLDLRTSDLCISRSGMIWDIKTGRNIKGGIRFPGPPPWHFRCRTTLIPITRSYSELARAKDRKAAAAADKIARENPGTQASMDGQVAADLNYEGWLKKQSVNRQLQVLGRGRYELWKAKKISLRDLTDPVGNTLRLEELVAKYTGN